MFKTTWTFYINCIFYNDNYAKVDLWLQYENTVECTDREIITKKLHVYFIEAELNTLV